MWVGRTRCRSIATSISRTTDLSRHGQGEVKDSFLDSCIPFGSMGFPCTHPHTNQRRKGVQRECPPPHRPFAMEKRPKRQPEKQTTKK